MLDRLNDDIDEVNDNMIRVEGRMKHLLKKSRLCCCGSVPIELTRQCASNVSLPSQQNTIIYTKTY